MMLSKTGTNKQNNMNKTTKKVKLLLLNESKTSLAERIGITRPTLDNRLMFSNWKLSECKLIETL